MSKRLTVVLDDELYERFQQSCAERQSDVSKTIRAWIIYYLDHQEKPTETRYNKRQKKGITFKHRR
jgi:metal-responsive CopG/Arc/MetJ family transcriptional regulator